MKKGHCEPIAEIFRSSSGARRARSSKNEGQISVRNDVEHILLMKTVCNPDILRKQILWKYCIHEINILSLSAGNEHAGTSSPRWISHGIEEEHLPKDVTSH